MSGFALLCAGQGALFPGMLDFALQSNAGRLVIEAFSKTFSTDLAALSTEPDFHDGGQGPESWKSGSSFHVRASQLSQPLAVACALANWYAISHLVPTPSICAGYSVGELSAWACAGIWSVGDAAAVTALRSAAMHRVAPADGGMLAVRGISGRVVADIARAHQTPVAIYNGDDHFILAGRSARLHAAERDASQAGAWTQWLDVHVPSHTPLLLEAASEFGERVMAIPQQAPAFRVLQGVNANPLASAPAACPALAKAICAPIRWADCMHRLHEEGISVAIELGPGAQLSKMMREAHPSMSVRAISDFRTPEGVATWVARELASS